MFDDITFKHRVSEYSHGVFYHLEYHLDSIVLNVHLISSLLYSYTTQITMAGFDSALAPFTLKGFYLCTWGTAVGTNVWQTLVCLCPFISFGVVINLDLTLTSSLELGHSSPSPDRHSVLSKLVLLHSTSQPQRSSLQPSC